MTQEEKAKAYDEALERAKCWLNSPDMINECDYTVEDAIQSIFPELKETEDERIRKGLIEALKTSKTVGELKFTLPEPTREECIAYLEKQKFKDDEEKYLDDIKRDWFERGKKEVLTVPELYGLEKQKEQKHPNGCFTCDEYKKGYEEGRRNGFTAGYNKAMKEQKPVEVKDPFSNANFVRGYESGYADAKREQKPDTRDCDDLQLLGFVHDLLNEIEWKDDWAMSKEECLRRLNNYRPQKPAEWSNKDEEMMTEIIEFLEYAYPYDNEFRIAWLKSLRPSWKPSEEQMKMLAMFTNLRCASRREANTLESLYNDLKKLM